MSKDLCEILDANTNLPVISNHLMVCRISVVISWTYCRLK